MHRRALLPIALVAFHLLAAGVGTADAQTAPRRAPAKAAAAPSAEMQSLLKQMADHQKWVGEQVWSIKEGVDAMPGRLAELKDQVAATQERLDKSREEVKGLYVELSSLRQQLAELKGDLGGVNSNVSGFRTFAGFFIAAMLLLLVVIFAMVVRR